MSQLPNKGAAPPWTPALAGEAKKVPSEMTGVSFVKKGGLNLPQSFLKFIWLNLTNNSRLIPTEQPAFIISGSQVYE